MEDDKFEKIQELIKGDIEKASEEVMEFLNRNDPSTKSTMLKMLVFKKTLEDYENGLEAEEKLYFEVIGSMFGVSLIKAIVKRDVNGMDKQN